MAIGYVLEAVCISHSRVNITTTHASPPPVYIQTNCMYQLFLSPAVANHFFLFHSWNLERNLGERPFIVHTRCDMSVTAPQSHNNQLCQKQWISGESVSAVKLQVAGSAVLMMLS